MEQLRKITLDAGRNRWYISEGQGAENVAGVAEAETGISGQSDRDGL